MLLDEFMPRHDFGEYHQALALATPARAFAALRDLDMSRAPLVRALLTLRELPVRLERRDFQSQGLGRSLSQMLKFGFILLESQEPQEMVLGLVGRFWTPRPQIVRLSPAEFREFARPGLAKVAANFRVEPLGGRLCRLSTETRVLCLDQQAKAGFRPYWTLIRPFSGLIRREWLRLARQQAEKGAGI